MKKKATNSDSDEEQSEYEAYLLEVKKASDETHSFIMNFTEEKKQEMIQETLRRLDASLEVTKKYGDITGRGLEAMMYRNRYDFSKVQKLLKKPIETIKKLKFLYEVKADFDRDYERIDSIRDEFLFKDIPSFGKNCQIEIEKFEKLFELEIKLGQIPDSLKKHKDLTLDRAVLAISYLLDELNVKCPLSKKKEFIDFITPYSPNTIKTKLENLHEKQEKNFVEYERDLQIISKYFENLGLHKIIGQIKADLEFE